MSMITGHTPEINAVNPPSLLDNDMVKAYSLSASDMDELADVLWSETFDFAGRLRKNLANPMDAIILCKYVKGIILGDSEEMTIGGIPLGFNAVRINQEYYLLSLGSLRKTRQDLCYLDYAPYTKVQIYLPYIGVKEIDPDLIWDHTINVTYRISSITGNCIAFVTCDNKVIGQYDGNCSMDVPLTGGSNNFLTAGINALVGLGMTVGGIATANPGVALAGAKNVVESVGSAQTNYEISGSLKGESGFYSTQYAYLIISTTDAYPNDANDILPFEGAPSSYTVRQLKDFSGYTKIIKAHLDGLGGATQSEKDELENILRGGIII